MDHRNGQLLPISLGHIVLQAALGHAAPNNLAGADVNHVEYSSAILVGFDGLPRGLADTHRPTVSAGRDAAMHPLLLTADFLGLTLGDVIVHPEIGLPAGTLFKATLH